MENFYKDQYELVKKKNEELLERKENTMKIFTTIIIVVVFPLLNMILGFKKFGYKLACYIVFTILMATVAITLFYTVFLYLKRYKTTVPENLRNTKELENQIYDRYSEIINNELDEKIKEILCNKRKKLFKDIEDSYYIDLYREQLENYYKKLADLKIYYGAIVVNIIFEAVLAVLIVIGKIFLL